MDPESYRRLTTFALASYPLPIYGFVNMPFFSSKARYRQCPVIVLNMGLADAGQVQPG